MIFNFKFTKDAKTLGGHSADEFLKTGDTASNSEKLGGRGADEFAKKDDLSGYVSKTGESNIVGKLRVNGNSVVDSVSIKEQAILIHGGGTVLTANDTVMGIKNTTANANRVYFGLYAQGLSSTAYIGAQDGKPHIGGADGWGYILHTGNSAKVHIGTAAPSDTSALWVDISA